MSTERGEAANGAAIGLGRRCLSSVGGGAAAALAAGGCEARWVRAAGAEGPEFGALLGVSAGLLLPLGLILGGLAGVAAIAVAPSAPPSASGLGRWARDREPRSRAELAVLAAVAPVAAVVWVVTSSQIALRVLAGPGPSAPSGAAMGLAVVGVAVAVTISTFGLAVWLSDRLVDRNPDPLAFGAMGLVVAVALFSFGIVSGTTSGGAGLGILGVLKRPELDLRAPGLLLLVAAVGYTAPSALGRFHWAIAVFLSIVPLGLTWRAATSALDDRKVALAIERGAPLSKMLLPRYRKLWDADRDGFGRLFGGGDCDDADSAIFPGAHDTPGNGIDEDCSGADDVEVELDQPKPEAPKDAKTWVAEKIPDEPSVILVTIDTLRWDLGYMGYERAISKNLDELAKRSVVFEKAYALASYTGKSVGPMLIGKYTSETHRGWSHFNRFGKEDTFVAQRLQKAGVRTVSIQGHWYFKEDTGLGRGFDVLDLSASPKVLQMEGDRTVNSDKLTDAAIDQLSKPENTIGRFFFWVHYLDPHAEYVKHDDFDFGPGNRERYDGEVAFTDHHIGRLLDFVSKQPFAKRTAILVTSDHGEAFGEHGMIRHGFEVWEELVRVPLIVYAPGAEAKRIGVRRGAVDIVPTILDYFDVELPPGDDDFVSGQSLLFDVYGPVGHEPEPRIVFVDMSAGPNNAERQAFIENDLKLIATGGRPLGLYDLAKDPGEKKDRLDDAELRAKVLPRFKAFRRKLREVKVRPIPK